MNNKKKCVVIIDDSLPIWIKINTCAILMPGLSKIISNMVWPDITDASWNIHKGITNIAISILKSNKKRFK